MNIAIISYSKDKASANIKENLIHNFDFNKLEEQFDNNNIFQAAISNDIIRLYTINSEHIYTDNLDKKIGADLFIFISRHSAVKGRPSLTCHPIGNFGKAEKGGKEKTLCPINSVLLKNIFIELNRNANDPDYEVTMEATHHGPFLEKPVLFVEIGSTEKEWADKNAGSIIAKSVINTIKNYNNTINNKNDFNNYQKNDDSIIKNSIKNNNCNYDKNLMEKLDDENDNSINNENNSTMANNNPDNNKNSINNKNNYEESSSNLMNKSNNYESVFVIGGSHYNYVAAKAMLKTNFAVGHICPKYNLKNLDESLIREAMEKTVPKAKLVLLEWKGLGKEKQRILESLENNHIEFKRSDREF